MKKTDYLKKYNNVIEINLSNLKYNFESIKAVIGDKKICCVVKADAYGLGAKKISKTLQDLGCDFFAVANLNEGIKLRTAGIVKPILILGSTPVCHVKKLFKYNLIQTVYSFGYAKNLSDEAVKNGVTVDCHLKIDTGMGRIGFLSLEKDNDLFGAYSALKLPELNFKGVFTHFSRADCDQEYTDFQYRNFVNALNYFNGKGFKFDISHCDNSSSAIKHGVLCSMARIGILLYGGYPDLSLSNIINVKPVVTLKSRIIHIKTVNKGDWISYGKNFLAHKKMKIATLPIGYADGLKRNEKFPVFINGKYAKITGNICMDQMMVDISGISCNYNDHAVIFGEGGLSVNAFAEKTHTIPYEVLTSLGKRIKRIYL